MNKNNLKWQLPFLVLLIVGTVLILRKQSPYQTDQGLVFGTVYKITYQSSENLKAEIEKELQKVDNSLSPFNKQSVITHINHNTDMRADSLFAYVFNLAKTISNETGKAYDVTVAPLVNAWGFGFKHSQFPDSLTIDSLRQFVSIDKIQLNAEGEVVKADPRMMLDFSSIAKGFGVDCVARLFDRKGIRNYMIDIGGELVLKGQNSKMEPWRIGINKPIDDSLSVNQELQTVLEITNAGMATSGNYRNFYYKDGKKYAHTIDLARDTRYSTIFFHLPSSPRTVPQPMPTPLPSWYWDWIQPRPSVVPILSWMPISSTRTKTGNCRLTPLRV